MKVIDICDQFIVCWPDTLVMSAEWTLDAAATVMMSQDAGWHNSRHSNNEYNDIIGWGWDMGPGEGYSQSNIGFLGGCNMFERLGEVGIS